MSVRPLTYVRIGTGWDAITNEQSSRPGYGTGEYLTSDRLFAIHRYRSGWRVYSNEIIVQRHMIFPYKRSGINKVVFSRRIDAINALEQFMDAPAEQGLTPL